MMTSPTASQSQVSTATHCMPNMDVRHMFAATSLMLHVCRRLCAEMLLVWADITLPTCTNHQLNTGTTEICHQSFLILQSWLETLTAIVLTHQEADLNGESLQECALNNDYLLLHDAKQRGTFHSAKWQREYSPDLCWISTTVGRSQPASSVVLGDFPHSQH